MLQSSEALKECARAHEEAVITKDEYGIAKIVDPNVEYIVDIGGNVGAASIQLHTYFPNAKIILVEPEPENMKYAKLNTENALIYAEEAVVPNEAERVVKLNVCHWGGNHHVDGHFRWDLFSPMGSRKVSEIIVPAITLRALIDQHGFPRIDILKIDCEGYEGEILQSYKPWMHLVRHFRGEWHGQEDIPLIEDAFKDTHNVTFEHEFTTHGGIVAELK